MLGLGNSLINSGKIGPTIVRDGLVLQHNYQHRSVELLSSGAASFDGTDDYIALGASNSLVTGTNVTLACWFQLLGDENTYLFQNQKGSNSSNIFLRLNSDGHGFIGAGVWTGSTHSIISFDGNVDTTSSWHHIAYVTTSSAQTLYLDGVAVATSTSTFANAASSDQSVLGSLNGVNSFLKGYMANMGVWSAALSQAQVKSIMNKNYDSLSASEKTDLVSWWNLDSVIPDTTTLVYDNHHGGVEVLGVELVNCVGFDCVDPAAVWSEQAGWSFSGGKAIYDGTGGTSGLIQSNVIEVGKQYKVIVEVLSNQGSGSNTIYLGGTVLSSSHLSVGTHVFYGATSNTNVSLYIYGRSGEVFEIGSFSAKEINGNTGTLS